MDPETPQSAPPRLSRRVRSVGRPLTLIRSFHPQIVGRLLVETYLEWSRKNSPRLGAALAFYTIFSLAPLLLVLMAVAGFFLGEEAARGQLAQHVEQFLGRTGAQIVRQVLQSTQKPAEGLVATVLSLGTLFFGASLAVSELRNALNLISGVPVSEEEKGIISGVLSLVRQRFFALSMVVGIGFLILLSVVANTVLSAAGKYFSSWLPMSEGVLQFANFSIGFLIMTLLFMFIYKVLPDARIAWKDVVVGAAVTSLLFTTGRLLISLYLGKSSIGSPYGAAGSVVVLLAWIYYSSQVFFFGAEFTEIYATHYGSRLDLRRRRWVN